MCAQVTTLRAVGAFSLLLCLASTVAVNLTNTPSAYTLRKLFDEEICVHYNYSDRNERLIEVFTVFHSGYGMEHPVTDDCKCLCALCVGVCVRKKHLLALPVLLLCCCVGCTHQSFVCHDVCQRSITPS